MTRIKSILFATILTLAVSTSAFAGDITTRTRTGDITTRSSITTTRSGDITTIVGNVLSVISVIA